MVSFFFSGILECLFYGLLVGYIDGHSMDLDCWEVILELLNLIFSSLEGG